MNGLPDINSEVMNPDRNCMDFGRQYEMYDGIPIMSWVPIRINPRPYDRKYCYPLYSVAGGGKGTLQCNITLSRPADPEVEWDTPQSFTVKLYATAIHLYKSLGPCTTWNPNTIAGVRKNVLHLRERYNVMTSGDYHDKMSSLRIEVTAHGGKNPEELYKKTLESGLLSKMLVSKIVLLLIWV